MRELQAALKKKFMGKEFWEAHVRSRGEMTDIKLVELLFHRLK
jgi:hypothetical protein